MRILHVIPSLSTRTGGPAGVVLDAAAALREIGVETTIYATDMDAPAAAGDRARITADDLPAASRAGVRLFPHTAPARLAFSPAMQRELWRAAESFDVVHIHSLYLFPQFAAYRAARNAGVPFVVSPRGTLDPYLRRRSRAVKAIASATWQRGMLRHAARLHVTSEEEGRQIADVAADVPRAVIPNGIRCTDYAALPPGAAFRAKHVSGFDGPLVLYLGRLSEKKGLDVLVRAFAGARRTVPDARLAIIGPDDEGLAPRLRRLAAAEGAAEAVTFVGLLSGEDKLEALAAADVWALPSHGENFGNAVVEAMAAGRAVAISPQVNIAGDAELAGAAIIAERDPAAFASALVALLGDPARRREMGERARAFVRRYDWSAVAPRMAEMYEDIVRAA